MEIRKLKKMPYANAFVEYDTKTGNTYLWSYRTLVVMVEDRKVYVNGLYSQTTRRHISAFANEYLRLDYSTMKNLYNDNYVLDLETGELLDRE
jgi:hypothetical protein